MVWATCVPQAVVSASMTTSVKFSHTVFNVPLLGLNNCSDLLQSRDLWPRTSYLNSACCKNKIPLASVHDEQIRTTKSRNDFNYSSSEFFDVTNAFRLMSFLLRMLLREFSGERCKKASVEIGLYVLIYGDHNFPYNVQYNFFYFLCRYDHKSLHFTV